MEVIDNKKQEEFADALLVQKNQRQSAEKVVATASVELDNLDKLNQNNANLLDDLLMQAELLCQNMGISEEDVSEEDIQNGMQLIELDDEDREHIVIPYFDTLDTIQVSDSWDEYFSAVKDYAQEAGIDLSVDPYDQLLTETEKNLIGQRLRDDYLMKKAHCDKYDYIIAAVCGVFSGLIDSFFVGTPEESKLGKWTDKMADNYVQWLSKKLWKSDSKQRKKIMEMYNNKQISLSERNSLLKEAGIPYNQNLKTEPDTLQSCIQYLEKKFGVNYDAASAKGVVEDNVLKGMNPNNHHLMSLAHSPTPIGLIFSIIDQFTGKATFVDDGKLVRLTPVGKNNEIDQFELRGGNFPTKLLCGIINWLGHLSSDLVGANTTRTGEGNTKRGTGLPAPFLEIMQMCNFELKDKDGKSITMSKLALKIFENGYDLRFTATCAIPVLINEFLIRLLWALKSRFYHGNSWADSMPFGNHPELRRMLLVGHGTLCSIDAVDAGLRSGGNLVDFMCHLNVVAWSRLAFSGLQEVRALYKENVIDVNALDDDLEIEWKRIYGELV